MNKTLIWVLQLAYPADGLLVWSGLYLSIPSHTIRIASQLKHAIGGGAYPVIFVAEQFVLGW